MPKYIRPDEPVGMKITAAERNPLCEDVTFLDDKYSAPKKGKTL